MTKAEADEVFAHHDAIASVEPGTRLIAKEAIASGYSTPAIPEGSHLRVLEAGQRRMKVQAALGVGLEQIWIEGDEFHKLAILGDAVPSQWRDDPKPDAPFFSSKRFVTVARDPMLP